MNDEKWSVINTGKAPKAIGPYVQGIEPNKSGTPVSISGQIPINPETGRLVSEDIVEQTHQVFDNMEAILKEAGLSLKDILHMRVMLDNIEDYAKVNKVYAERFGDHKPTREAFAVDALPMGAKIEIVATAWREK